MSELELGNNISEQENNIVGQEVNISEQVIDNSELVETIPKLSEDDIDAKIINSVDQIESLCMSCHENGMTTLFIHKVPYFRELIIASFRCSHCGENNNEVTFGGEIQLQGCIYELNVTKSSDLDRQLIKSDSATIKIPIIDFEIPPMTQKGEISTIEGFLRVAIKNLSMYQNERMQQTPEIGIKVAEIILQLSKMASGDILPFTIQLDDPSGNSFIQNPLAPTKDPQLKVGHYRRSPEQDSALGLQPDKGTYRYVYLITIISYCARMSYILCYTHTCYIYYVVIYIGMTRIVTLKLFSLDQASAPLHPPPLPPLSLLLVLIHYL